MSVNSRPPPPSAPMLTLPENSRIRSVTSGHLREDVLGHELRQARLDVERSDPRRIEKAIAVTGTSDSAVWNASAAACCGHLSRAHCARIRSASR